MLDIESLRKYFDGKSPEYIGNHREFSVLIPIVQKGDELYFMYEVRSQNLSSDPGEICFPGGHVEKGESFKAAAFRETYEETGIPEEKIEYIRQGDILQGYANYTLYTFVGLIKYEDYLKANIRKDEVEELFLVSLSDIKQDEIDHICEKVIGKSEEPFPYEKIGIDENYRWRYGTWIIPIIKVDGRTIWGLTARITEHVLRSLMPDPDRSVRGTGRNESSG